MRLNDLPREIVSRCFSYLSTDLLTDIILLENIPDIILQAAADNLNNLWYFKRFRRYEINKIEGIEAHYETDFDRFVRIHKNLEEKSLKCPLWFHYIWENISQMHQSLDEIKSIYNGQELGIHGDFIGSAFQNYPFFSDHDINLNVTCLSLKNSYGHLSQNIDLNNFPKLETFYGDELVITVDHNHPRLKNLYLKGVTFSTLPVNLKKLVTRWCSIEMNENHPKLEALTVLALENTLEPSECSLLLRLLRKDLEHFSYTPRYGRDDYENRGVIEGEIYSKLGKELTSLGFSGSVSSTIPRLLRSLYSYHGGSFENLPAFTQMTSLTLELPTDNINSFELPPNLLSLTLVLPGVIDSLKFPLNLVKLSITDRLFKNIAKVKFPPNLVDLKLDFCGITLTVGWLKTARLKRLSLARNNLSSFEAVLPCCEFLSLERNILKKVEIEVPVLEHIDLDENKLFTIPKLPACLKVLILSNNVLYLPIMSELPPNLKVLDLSRAGFGAPRNYTFPSSIQELNFRESKLSSMRGVKFAKGSRLRELILSTCDLNIVDDTVIELPLGLKSLELDSNHLKHINKLTIPQTVTFLDLGENDLRSLKIKSHIETLYLDENPKLSSLAISKKLELKFLDFSLTGFKKFSFDLIGAERLAQLRLDGYNIKVIDLSKMPVNFQVLEYCDGPCEIKELHRYPGTDIYRRFP